MSWLMKRALEWYFKKLVAYREHDKRIEKFMKDEIIAHYNKLSPYENKEEGLEEILNYKTRLWEAGTVEALTICGGNMGFENSVKNKVATDIAITLRLAFGYADIKDTDNDDYDPRILSLKNLDKEAVKEKRHKHNIYQGMIKNLDELLLERFKLLHPSTRDIFESESRNVEGAQAVDIKDHLCYLKGEFDNIRNRHSNIESIMGVLEGKVGWMGRGAAKIAYIESGGRNNDIMDAEIRFFTSAGTLLQFRINDMKKLLNDVENLDTNPIITYAICKYRAADTISRELVIKVLKEDPTLLNRMAEPYEKELSESLKKIKRFNFDSRTHKGLALMVRSEAEKEKTNLLRTLKL